LKRKEKNRFDFPRRILMSII